RVVARIPLLFPLHRERCPMSETAHEESAQAKQERRMRERRAFRRRPLRATLRYQADSMGLGGVIEGVPADISEDGVGFITSKPPAIRSVITVVISRKSINREIRRPAEVMWMSALEEGRYRVGCRWERRLSFSEMQQFQ